MYDLILFSQAPADIQYVVYLYDKYKDSKKILIVVVNVENNFKYLKSLDLKAKIMFIPLVEQKKIFKYLIFVIKLRLIYRKEFSNFKDANIYFFAVNYDYVTAFFIERLKNKNIVYFIDIYKLNLKEIKSLFNTVKKRVMLTLLGIKVIFSDLSYKYIFDLKSIKKINLLINEDKLFIYKYNVLKEKDTKNLLFFESNSGENDTFVDYQKSLQYFMDNISKKYHIYIKPHPRLGYSNILNSYNITIIPSYIPSEMLILDAFDIAVGIDSISITQCNLLKKYSLINLFEYKDEKRKEYMLNYLNKLGFGPINCINLIEEIT